MGMDKKESVFEELKQEARYAQGSYSEQLLYQAYGKAQMARQLEAITQDEFMEINGMTIRFMNITAVKTWHILTVPTLKTGA